ncbi:MAG: Uma2 family endonuclease [Bacteroidetes bacterium]|nr:MAG: Uma2 family endonuclease [Bacteroidota bacterium]
MSYLPDPLVPYTWEAYLELEAQADTRYEYHDGAIQGMAGASNRHNEVCGNCYTLLRQATRGRSCKPFAMEVKLFRYQSLRYLYPDLMVTCNPLDIQTANGVRSPLLIIEVLSNSTREADRSFKLREYLKLPSLRHYLLVEQQHCEVQHFRRQAEGQPWEVCFYEYITDVIALPELDLHLRLTDVYEGIVFGPELTLAQEEAEAYSVE